MAVCEARCIVLFCNASWKALCDDTCFHLFMYNVTKRHCISVYRTLVNTCNSSAIGDISFVKLCLLTVISFSLLHICIYSFINRWRSLDFYFYSSYKPRRNWDDNIKTDFYKMQFEGVLNKFIRLRTGTVEYVIGISGFIKSQRIFWLAVWLLAS